MWLASLLLRMHRLLLVVGTVLIAVAASRLAAGSSSASAWLVLVGGAILMYEADVASELELTSIRLSRSSDISMSASRRDLLSSGRPRLLVFVVLISLALIAAGFWVGLI